MTVAVARRRDLHLQPRTDSCGRATATKRRSKATKAPGTKTSNKVEVEVPAKPSFTIEKLQKARRRSELHEVEADRGEVGETVDYEIIVKNTGNVALKFKPLSDAGCTGITPSGEETVAAIGGEQTYTCDHMLTSTGVYGNEATHRRQRRHRARRPRTRSKSKCPPDPRFTIEKLQEDRRRSELHEVEPDEQNRPDRRLRDRRQEHRQRGS